MSQEKMTHEDFIKYCKKQNIMIEKISRNYVYISRPGFGTNKNLVLPNNCTLKTDNSNQLLSDIKIQNWSVDWINKETCLLQLIVDNRKIGAIQVIRKNTGCGLRESKDIVESNWEIWKVFAEESGYSSDDYERLKNDS